MPQRVLYAPRNRHGGCNCPKLNPVSFMESGSKQGSGDRPLNLQSGELGHTNTTKLTGTGSAGFKKVSTKGGFKFVKS